MNAALEAELQCHHPLHDAADAQMFVERIGNYFALFAPFLRSEYMIRLEAYLFQSLGFWPSQFACKLFLWLVF
jgi:hypothetical protein